MDSIKQFCIQLADAIFRKQYRDIENRKFIRLKDLLPVGIRLIDYETGKSYARQIRGSTLNISKEGLCIESTTATVDGIDIFNDAMSMEKGLEVEIEIPSAMEKIKSFAKVVWLDMTPKDKTFLFKAGVHLDLEKCSDKEGWFLFVEQARKYRKSQSWLLRTLNAVFKGNPES